MWTPKTEEEILAVITDGKIRETAIFEAKRQLPDKQKNYDIAIDIAAMTTDGGVIIYGLVQDDEGWIVGSNPLPIGGTPERITSIAQSTISEPPKFSIDVIPSIATPSLGYIVVHVPPSPRAPHMVIVNGQYRYYGRSDTGNRPLNEGEVARLYERRNRLEIDFEQLLRQEIENAPFLPTEENGNLCLVASPLFGDKDMLSKAAKKSISTRAFMSDLLLGARSIRTNDHWSPDFDSPRNWERLFDGYRCYVSGSDTSRRMRLDVQFDQSGSLHLFCGSAAWALRPRPKAIYSILVAGLALRFLYMAGKFYASAGYLAMVNVGCALTGIKDVSLNLYADGLHGDPVVCRQDEYRRVATVPASILNESYRGVAEELLMPLYAALSHERYDPFKLLLP